MFLSWGSLGHLILRAFPRGVPGGSSGGTQSKSSAQCKDSLIVQFLHVNVFCCSALLQLEFIVCDWF